MLRIVATGTRRELIWFQRNFGRWGLVELLEVSKMYDTKKSQKTHKLYIKFNRMLRRGKAGNCI